MRTSCEVGFLSHRLKSTYDPTRGKMVSQVTVTGG